MFKKIISVIWILIAITFLAWLFLFLNYLSTEFNQIKGYSKATYIKFNKITKKLELLIYDSDEKKLIKVDKWLDKEKAEKKKAEILKFLKEKGWRPSPSKKKE